MSWLWIVVGVGFAACVLVAGLAFWMRQSLNLPTNTATYAGLRAEVRASTSQVEIKNPTGETWTRVRAELLAGEDETPYALELGELPAYRAILKNTDLFMDAKGRAFNSLLYQPKSLHVFATVAGDRRQATFPLR